MQAKGIAVLLVLLAAPREEWRDRGPRGALAAAEYFIKTDLDAVGDHFGLVKPAAGSSDPTGDVAFSCTAPTVTVVTSYEIVGCVVRDGRASIEVRYQRVGAVVRDTFRREKEVSETVGLRLVYDSGQWWISAPVRTRVSPGALLECYRKHHAELDSTWWARASAAQKAYAGNLERNIAALAAIVGRQ